LSKIELVTRTEGVGKYKGMTSEDIISAIARHGVIKEDNGKLVKYLMTNKHWSPLDMINFGFEVTTSRAIARQWLRHSSLKPQEHSQRYSDKVEFETIELRKEDKVNRQSSIEIFNPVIKYRDFINTGDIFTSKSDVIISELLDFVESVYHGLIEAGVAKECARMILPECTSTTLTFNGSLRSWLSFLNVRLDHHAQKEIVDLAYLIGKELEQELPNVFKSIDWEKGMFM